MTAASGRRDGARAVVPVEATAEMIEAAEEACDWGPPGYDDAPNGAASPAKVWAAMRHASPSAGSISAEDLERAAAGAWAHTRQFVSGRKPWGKQPKDVRAAVLETQRAAFEAAGLTVAPDGATHG